MESPMATIYYSGYGYSPYPSSAPSHGYGSHHPQPQPWQTSSDLYGHGSMPSGYYYPHHPVHGHTHTKPPSPSSSQFHPQPLPSYPWFLHAKPSQNFQPTSFPVVSHTQPEATQYAQPSVSFLQPNHPTPQSTAAIRCSFWKPRMTPYDRPPPTQKPSFADQGNQYFTLAHFLSDLGIQATTAIEIEAPPLDGLHQQPEKAPSQAQIVSSDALTSATAYELVPYNGAFTMVTTSTATTASSSSTICYDATAAFSLPVDATSPSLPSVMTTTASTPVAGNAFQSFFVTAPYSSTLDSCHESFSTVALVTSHVKAPTS